MVDSVAANDVPKDNFYMDIGKWLSHPSPGDEVVISGLAGKLPECKNISDFRKGLYDKIDMITDKNRRCGKFPSIIPQRYGEVPGINKFDPGYFGIQKEMADVMDATCRLQLEGAIEAILDAGVNPAELEGTKAGVYVATGNCETQPLFFRDDLKKKNVVMGCARSMSANRISYHLKLNGPSCCVDSACSSAMYALCEAFNDIRDGKVDAAIVTGAILIIKPSFTLGFKKLGILSDDGKAKVFDESADGYVRSEMTGAIFMQKAKDCRRVYAKVVHVLVNCAGYNDIFITHPSEDSQTALLTDLYEQCNIPPSSVDYVEAHGTGTTIGDIVEIRPIDKIFCNNREDTLIVGSVKSNIGHSENAAAHGQIIKSILIMETGMIPPNLHIKTPLRIDAFQSGRIAVPTEVTAFKGDSGRIAISSFGFGGANGHCLLEWNTKVKLNNGVPQDDLPRLVCISGRCEESVTSIINHLKNNPLDSEFVALLHKIHRYNSSLDVYRGFTIITKEREVASSVSRWCTAKPKIYILFGEYSSRHIKSDIFTLPAVQCVFERIDKCCSLEGASISNVLQGTGTSTGILKEIVFQITILDILQTLGLEYEYCNSYFGEGIVDAYAKKELPLEEALKLAVSLENRTWQSEEFVEIPNGKLYNGSNCGNKKLNEINSYITLPTKENIAYTKYVDNPHLDIISTENNGDNLQTHPSDYVLLNFVRTNDDTESDFDTEKEEEEQCTQFIIDFEDGLVSFLTAIGSLYQLGHNPDISKLYLPIEFPVGRGTPMISPLLKWDHREDWFSLSFKPEDQPKVYSLIYSIDPRDSEWAYIKGHTIDGRNLLPATACLFLVWKMFSVIQKTYYGDMHIVFENVKFLRATTLADEKTDLSVSILSKSGYFEVMESNSVIAKGKIRTADAANDLFLVENVAQASPNEQKMLKKDVYKELKLRGYDYSDLFKGIEEYYPNSLMGYIKWVDENWIAYMDLMLQMCILPVERRQLYVPTYIETLRIDAPNHLKTASATESLPVQFFKDTKSVRSGFIHIKGLNATAIPRRKATGEPVLEKYVFVPNKTRLGNIEESIRINMQIVLENCYKLKVKVAELIDIKNEIDPVSALIFKALSDLPLIQPDITILSPFSFAIENIKVENKKLSSMDDASIVVAQNLLTRPEVMEDALKCISLGGFLLSREHVDFNHSAMESENIDVLTVHTLPNEKMVLLRYKKQIKMVETCFLNMSRSSEQFDWLSSLQTALKEERLITLYVESDPLNGILGFINCLRREPGGENAKCIFVKDKNAPRFDPNEKFYRSVIRKGLAVNVYLNGKWGTYRHLKLENNLCMLNDHCFVTPSVRGDLSSLSWIQGPSCHELEMTSEQEFVHVFYAALNFKDIMLATNRLSSTLIHSKTEKECPQGLEFSGVNKRGVRIMGMCDSGSLANCIAADKYFIQPVPDDWTLEDAATVPVVYTTVLYAFSKTKLTPGKSILVHAGAGGIGQAAINLALFHKLDIFVTVGTPAKREYIKRYYPSIQDSHIGNSRDTSFARMIYKETKGKGVDIVLNSLAEEKLLASVRCLAHGGTFLEIGKYDLAENNSLHLELLNKDAVFHGVCLDRFFNAEPRLKAMLSKLIVGGIRNGSIKPLRRICFGENEVVSAYRYMATGKHTGKVLIKVRDDESNCSKSELCIKNVNASPRYYCYSQYSYIITGGLGGFGLELADWLVNRGARKLVLSSRVGVKTGYQQCRISKWKSIGCTVLVSTADISSKSGCESLLKESEALAPVAALFHLAVVLKDAVFENQTVESWKDCLAPKALSAKLLDDLSRTMCPNLRDFVVFSSVTCGRGTAGQTNYGMANSIMERICEDRKHNNLPALAIQWGAVGDYTSPAFHKPKFGKKYFRRKPYCGFVNLWLLDAFVVTIAILSYFPGVTHHETNYQDIVLLALEVYLIQWNEVGLVAEMQKEDKEIEIGGTLQQKISGCLEVMDCFLTEKNTIVSSMIVAEKRSIVKTSDNLVEAVAHMLGIKDLKTVSMQATLPELGMDSMMANEIKQYLEREKEIFLSPVELRNLTFAGIHKMMLEREDAQKSGNNTEKCDEGLHAPELYLKQFFPIHTNEQMLRLGDKMHNNEPTVFFLPGIESRLMDFKDLLKTINGEKWGINYNKNSETDTIKKEAYFCFESIKQVLSSSKSFNIVAHSYGCVVAMELASLLEKEDCTGKVVLIDGAPKAFNLLLEKRLGGIKEADLDLRILKMIMSAAISDMTKITENLDKCRTTDEMMKIALGALPQNMYSDDYLMQLCRDVHRRVVSLNRYKASMQIKSQVYLCKPETVIVPVESDDYYLSELSQPQVIVRSFKGDHSTILQDVDLGVAINSFLQ